MGERESYTLLTVSNEADCSFGYHYRRSKKPNAPFSSKSIGVE